MNQVMNVCIVGDGFIGNELAWEISSFPGLKVYRAPNEFKKPYKLSAFQTQNLTNYFKETNIRVIINVAGPTDIQNSFVNQHTYTSGQLEQVQEHVKILEALPSRCDYIYLSSGSVYGSTALTGASETDAPNPLSPYAEGKLMAENFLKSAMQDKKFARSLYILRGFSLYSHLKANRLLSRICDIYSMQAQPELFGDGLETRDYISVAFFSKVVERVIYNRGNMGGGVYNLSSGIGLNIREICEIARNISKVGSKIEINFSGQERQGDPKYMVGINTLLLDELSLEPEMPVDGISTLFANCLR
jgi:nucleoside-diphosphate-sugar epimerase